MLPVEELARLIEEERHRRTVRPSGNGAVRRGRPAHHNLRSIVSWLTGRAARDR